MRIKKNSHLRDNLFWYIIIATVFYFGVVFCDALKAETPGLKEDLSGEKYPVPNIKTEGVNFSETINKTELVLDKIERVEKEKDKIYYDKITTIEPKNAASQYCYVKVIIKQQGNNIVKEEILECADGRKKVDGPSYWELFAQFYYRDVSAPEYCRFYSRPNHVFKSFGKTCLNKDGQWEVQ